MDEDLRDVLEEGSPPHAVTDFHLAFSAERKHLGNLDSVAVDIPKVLGGFNPECLKRTTELNSSVLNTWFLFRAAEATEFPGNISSSLQGIRIHQWDRHGNRHGNEKTSNPLGWAGI